MVYHLGKCAYSISIRELDEKIYITPISVSLPCFLTGSSNFLERVLKGLSVHRDITEHTQPHPSQMLGKVEMN